MASLDELFLPAGLKAETGRRTAVADLWLTPSSPEPAAGTVVETADGDRWWRDADHLGFVGGCNWFPWSELTNSDRHDPESWTKVAGNYGPVRIVWSLDG